MKPNSESAADAAAANHLVILKPHFIKAILSGRKNTEVRLSKRPAPPFNCVRPGDILWLKRAAGPILVRAVARHVTCLTIPRPGILHDAAASYTNGLVTDLGYFAAHRTANYATIILLGNVTRVNPIPLNKKDRRAWVILRSPPQPTAPCTGPVTV